VVGGVNYTISFGVSIAGTPNLFVARVIGAAGSTFYQLLASSLDVLIEKDYTIAVTVPADVTVIKLSFAGQGVRTSTHVPNITI
jgi:hypothetical protein